MKKVLITLVVVLLIGVVYAGPIGSPVATLEQGKTSVGLDLSRQTQDVKIYGTDFIDGTVEEIQTDMTSLNLNYGVTDRFNVFGRLGYTTVEDNPTSRLIGLGARATFWEQDNLSIGMTGSFNIMRLETQAYKYHPGWKLFHYCQPSWIETIPVNVDLTEIVLAVGPTYKIDDQWTVYGGPAIYYLDGDIETNNSNLQDGSLQETTSIMGYVGASWEFMKDLQLVGEYQFGNGNFQNIGIGINWKF